jgi:DnaK suppressor protein
MNLNASQVRERLQTERRQVAEQIENLRASLARSLEDEIEEDGSDSHPGDSATATFDREVEVTLEDTLEDQLAQIDGALERVEAGTYGICIECGRQIQPDRLEALPYTDRCIDCARAHP